MSVNSLLLVVLIVRNSSKHDAQLYFPEYLTPQLIVWSIRWTIHYNAIIYPWICKCFQYLICSEHFLQKSYTCQMHNMKRSKQIQIANFVQRNH